MPIYLLHHKASSLKSKENEHPPYLGNVDWRHHKPPLCGGQQHKAAHETQNVKRTAVASRWLWALMYHVYTQYTDSKAHVQATVMQPNIVLHSVA